jgi:membrane fusion protein (multidrug efflux system)
MRSVAVALIVILLIARLPAAWTADRALPDTPVVALVVTAPAAERDLQAVVAGFGKVETDANSLLAITVPHNGIVSRLYVHVGQAVASQAPLLDLASTPAAHFSFEQARTALGLARADLARTERLLAEQLATRDQIDKAQGALRDAEAALKAQTQAGADRAIEQIAAPFAGTVTTLAATEGEQLPEGAKALTLARADALVARLGVEPAEAPLLRPGMAVRLADTFTRATFPGRLGAVDAVVNPQTRLVDVLVRFEPSGDDPPMIGAILRGTIVLERQHVLAVPRSAVLEDHEGTYVFVVQDGKARRSAVNIGLDDGKYVAVAGAVQSGDAVVVQGNYELEDGMAVRGSAGDGR